MVEIYSICTLEIQSSCCDIVTSNFDIFSSDGHTKDKHVHAHTHIAYGEGGESMCIDKLFLANNR